MTESTSLEPTNQSNKDNKLVDISVDNSETARPDQEMNAASIPDTPEQTLTEDGQDSTCISSSGDLDGFLLAALKNPKDRMFLLKLDQEMERFISDSSRTRLDFPQMNSYHRLIVHRAAAYFKLSHVVDGTKKAVVLYKNENTEIPFLRFTDLMEQEDVRQEKSFKIMRRHPTTHSATSTQLASSDNTENYSEAEKKHMTIEEREAAYAKARARIFKDLEEKKCPELNNHIENDPISVTTTTTNSPTTTTATSADFSEAPSTDSGKEDRASTAATSNKPRSWNNKYSERRSPKPPHSWYQHTSYPPSPYGAPAASASPVMLAPVGQYSPYYTPAPPQAMRPYDFGNGMVMLQQQMGTLDISSGQYISQAPPLPQQHLSPEWTGSSYRPQQAAGTTVGWSDNVAETGYLAQPFYPGFGYPTPLPPPNTVTQTAAPSQQSQQDDGDMKSANEPSSPYTNQPNVPSPYMAPNIVPRSPHMMANPSPTEEWGGRASTPGKEVARGMSGNSSPQFPYNQRWDAHAAQSDYPATQFPMYMIPAIPAPLAVQPPGAPMARRSLSGPTPLYHSHAHYSPQADPNVIGAMGEYPFPTVAPSFHRAQTQPAPRTHRSRQLFDPSQPTKTQVQQQGQNRRKPKTPPSPDGRGGKRSQNGGSAGGGGGGGGGKRKDPNLLYDYSVQMPYDGVKPSEAIEPPRPTHILELYQFSSDDSLEDVELPGATIKHSNNKVLAVFKSSALAQEVLQNHTSERYKLRMWKPVVREPVDQPPIVVTHKNEGEATETARSNK
ncbi:uncharacterized protein VTP21DRAFT_3835 [Calcarisporiella thermophila]|uniref:uncharacterized protein n=1 Tax=Calcarisporiella thermophila TaxID=911321 RepID=UPI00374337F2